MESRKLQKTGGSTYIVSLPKDWVPDEVSEGEKVFMDRDGDLINISFREEVDEKEIATVDYKENLDTVLRRIIAHYLNGTNRVVVRSDQLIEEKTEIEQLVRETLIGMEVTKVEANRMELRNLFRHSDLPVNNVLRRIDSTIKTMFRDLVSEPEKGIYTDIMEREEEIDRFYLLELRLLQVAIKDSEIREKIGIRSSMECLDYRLIVKSMERIGDHLRTIAENQREQREEIEEELQKVLEGYEQVSSSIFERDDVAAEDAIKKVEQIDAGDHSQQIANSIYRLRRLVKDIAETVINYSVPEEGEKKEMKNLGEI